MPDKQASKRWGGLSCAINFAATHPNTLRASRSTFSTLLLNLLYVADVACTFVTMIYGSVNVCLLLTICVCSSIVYVLHECELLQHLTIDNTNRIDATIPENILRENIEHTQHILSTYILWMTLFDCVCRACIFFVVSVLDALGKRRRQNNSNDF